MASLIYRYVRKTFMTTCRLSWMTCSVLTLTSEYYKCRLYISLLCLTPDDFNYSSREELQQYTVKNQRLILVSSQPFDPCDRMLSIYVLLCLTPGDFTPLKILYSTLANFSILLCLTPDDFTCMSMWKVWAIKG